MKKLIINSILLTVTICGYAQSAVNAIDLGLSVKWASHNIGASMPEQLGEYYAWGETKSKSNYFYDTYEFTEKGVDYQSCIDIGNHIAMTSHDVAHVLWGGKWSMPTEKEFLELIQRCEWSWTTINSVPGYSIVGPNGNSIFLPAGGKKSGTQKIEVEGCYWSETVNGGIGRTSRSLWFTKEKRNIWGEQRVSGLLIRPVIRNPNFVETPNLPIDWQDSKYKGLIKSISSEEYDNAFNEATMLSASGDAQAQCVLAAMYLCGVGTFRNYESAQELLVKAAKQGYSRGEYMLDGFGSLKKQHDFMKAFLGDDADEAGTDDNIFWYQMMSTETKPDNFKDAFNWFLLKEGEWGYRDIMFYAGIELIKGTYGYQNPENGLKWIVKSAQLGYGEAIELIEQLKKASENE